MKFSIRFAVLVVALVYLVSAAASAEDDMSPFQNERFSFSYLSDWKMKTDISSKKHTYTVYLEGSVHSVFTIEETSLKKTGNPKEYVGVIEKEIVQNLTGLFAPCSSETVRLEPDELKRMNADDGYMGVFIFDFLDREKDSSEKPEVEKKMYDIVVTLVKGDKVYTICMGTMFRDGLPALKDMYRTFRIKD